MGGGGIDGYFGEQGLPVGTNECLEKFQGGCVDYLSQPFVPKWDSRMVKVTARITSLLMEHVDAVA